MARLFLVSYDLHRPGKNYPELIAAIERLGDTNHCLLSAWLVHADMTADAIYQALKPHIDDNDNILITQLQGERTGWMPKSVWEWLNERRH